MITPDLIRARLRYVPETGKCFWIYNNPSHPRLFRKEAGCIRKYDRHPRVIIKINSKSYSRARVAFIYMTGRAPALVDHINGNSLDDRWKNLRPANPSQNNWNMGNRKKSSGLPVGVRKISSGRYQVRIAAHRKTHSLGTFTTVDDAFSAYLKMKDILHGEFAGRLK